MENTILDQAEQRMTDVKTQAHLSQHAISEAARDDIGRDAYTQAKAQLPLIEPPIRTEYRPFLTRIAAIAAKSPAPLPLQVQGWLREMADLCDHAPRQIRAGIEGYDSLTIPPWRDGSPDKVVRAKLVHDIRGLLRSWDGCLRTLKDRKWQVEAYLQQSGWPAPQPSVITIAPAAARGGEEVPVETDFLKGPRL
jgi:hypothetical protein